MHLHRGSVGSVAGVRAAVGGWGFVGGGVFVFSPHTRLLWCVAHGLKSCQIDSKFDFQSIGARRFIPTPSVAEL